MDIWEIIFAIFVIGPVSLIIIVLVIGFIAIFIDWVEGIKWKEIRINRPNLSNGMWIFLIGFLIWVILAITSLIIMQSRGFLD